MSHPLRDKIYNIIEGNDTRIGRSFDGVLIILILLSVLVVILDSVQHLQMQYGQYLHGLEWFFTVIFTIEYALRLYGEPKRWQYIISFYGIIDLISIISGYLSLLIVGFQYFLIIRIVRVLRIFRIFKLASYLQQAGFLMEALKSSRQKILVFFLFLITLATVFGALIFVIEGPQNGFTSIPRSMYWAIVTLTTVGYGDISPKTALGQGLASFIMITGYAILAVPTGIFTAELARSMQPKPQILECSRCGKAEHAEQAKFCDACGESLALAVSTTSDAHDNEETKPADVNSTGHQNN